MDMPKRKFGDRYDGYRVRHLDPLFEIIPSIMRTRTDAQVYFDYKLDITELEKFVRERRRSDMPDLRTLHVIMAALIRILSQMPRLNRFVTGKKVFARNCYSISIACKRAMSISVEETTITIEFEPEDTLYDVIEKVESAIRNDVLTENDNGTDKVAKTIGAIPTCIKSGFVKCIRGLDQLGFMPKAIHRASPFHASMFVTDLGSCGIGPIYHHLYEFGTCSQFVAIGKKETEYYIDYDGSTKSRRTIGMKIVGDERICDGYYYATAMKMLVRLIRRPEKLLAPPETVIMDNLGRKNK